MQIVCIYYLYIQPKLIVINDFQRQRIVCVEDFTEISQLNLNDV